MRVTYSREQLVTTLAEILELADKLGPADEELRGRSYDPGRGWPSSSGPGSGSGGGPSILVEVRPGDDGYDPAPGANNVDRVSSTSVEAAALRRDDVRDAKHQLWSKAQAARNALTEAWNGYEQATRPFRADPPPTPTDPDQIWCTSCARWGLHEPRGNPKEIGKTSTLCARCHRYQQARGGVLPPRRLCELISEGVRLTPKVVAEIEAAEKREQRERTTSKKRKKRVRR